MKLLVVTQAVDLDDPILGFFHRWLQEFAKRCGHIHVICLKEGVHNLPRNVAVHSLGKESGRSLLKYVVRFYRLIWTLRREYDAVFVHMNPEYVVLGGLLWRLWGKRIGLWYVHRSVTLRLRIALVLSHVVFTATKESLRVAAKKVRIVGHGVDTALFPLRAASPVSEEKRIVSVGRVSPVKRCEVLIEALSLLRERGIDASVAFVGPRDTGAYGRELDRLIDALGLRPYVRFEGPVRHADMPDVYERASAAVNMAPTGGSDKAVLESLVSGVPTFVCNRAFAELYGDEASRFMFAEDDAESLATHIAAFFVNENDAVMLIVTRARERADLPALIGAIVQAL